MVSHRSFSFVSGSPLSNDPWNRKARSQIILKPCRLYRFMASYQSIGPVPCHPMQGITGWKLILFFVVLLVPQWQRVTDERADDLQ